MKINKSNFNMQAFLHKTAAVSIAVWLFASCDDGNGKLSGQAKDDPAGTYRSYLSDVRKLDGLSFGELAEHIGRWQTVRDSVFAYAHRDTLENPHYNTGKTCERLHDSLRIEFSRLALSQPRTYQELLSLKEQLSPYTDDKELRHTAEDIRPFFISLDEHPAYGGDKPQTLSTYRALLAGTLRNGIHGMDDLTDYIRKEDAVFRAFLSHLHSFDGSNTGDITRDTEKCCSQIFLAAERKEITYPEAMVYLAMRTNRRLILNAETCIDDIRHKKVKTAAQAHAYIWMLLQPYVSMDGFCLTVLSPEDRERLDRLAARTPGAFEELSRILQSEGGRLSELPGMLMEIFIHRL